MLQTAAPARDLLKETAETHGFCIVKGLFSADQMEEIERCMARESANFPDGLPDLYSIPSLKWLLSDPQIQAIARRLLGPELVYYRLTNVAYEATVGALTEKPYDEFHCDARGLPDSLNSSDNTPPTGIYPAYRFALYCRDYTQHSGGLKVGVGSHMMPYMDVRMFNFTHFLKSQPKTRVTAGDLYFDCAMPPCQLHNIPSAPGDLVIFNLRTFHSAGALRFRNNPGLAILPALEAYIKRQDAAVPHLMPRAPGPRNAIFFDFASPTVQADLYIKWAASRGVAENTRLTPINTQAARGFAVRNDLSLVNRFCYLRQECAKRGIDLLGRDAPWPLPEPLHAVAVQFLGMCAAHTEFSPHYRLIDQDEYAATARHGDASAFAYAVRSVAAMLDAAARDHADLKAEGQSAS